jgi:hypothetical protein
MLMPDFKSYQERRNYSDAHLDIVKAALGRRFITISNFLQDVKLGYDLVVLEHRFAVRIRQSKYTNYEDFTLRSSGGGEYSEYAKMLRPQAPDWLFYGYALDRNTLAAGYLIDLRQWKISLMHGEIRPMFRKNRDGSHFVAFPLRVEHPRSSKLIHYVEQVL